VKKGTLSDSEILASLKNDEINMKDVPSRLMDKVETIEPVCPNNPSHVLAPWTVGFCPKCSLRLSGNYLTGMSTLD